MMKEQCKFKESCAFKNNIAEITSISLECQYETNENIINGSFIVEGSYRTHELSINQESFTFKLPFDYRLKDNVITDSINLSVQDFTYTTDENNLNIVIDYEVSFEVENEITTKEEFDRFLDSHEVEIVDLNEKTPDEEKIEDYFNEEKVIEEPEEVKEENEEIIEEESREVNVANTIIDNISERDNEYITYHVYICNEYDTLNSISDKFKVSIDTLKSYNNVDNLSAGMKVIIPSISDEN